MATNDQLAAVVCEDQRWRELSEVSLSCRIVTKRPVFAKGLALAFVDFHNSRIRRLVLDQAYQGSPAFRKAVRLFLRSPQTKLVRHIYISVANNPGYFEKNRRSIEQAVYSILAMQGMNPGETFQGSSVLELIRVAGKKLNIKVSEDWRTLVPP